MKIDQHPFETIDWKKIKREKVKGAKGKSWHQTVMMNNIRIRMVKYSAGYFADHWCNKGHVIYCITGLMTSALEDGRKFTLKKE